MKIWNLLDNMVQGEISGIFRENYIFILTIIYTIVQN